MRNTRFDTNDTKTSYVVVLASVADAPGFYGVDCGEATVGRRRLSSSTLPEGEIEARMRFPALGWGFECLSLF